MNFQTISLKGKLKVYAIEKEKKQEMKLTQYQIQQYLKSIGQSTELTNSNRMMIKDIADRYLNYQNWTFGNIYKILVQEGCKIDRNGDLFVPNQDVYPHFHIGKNNDFITLSLAHKATHIDVINSYRTASQFFAQVQNVKINSSDNGIVIQKMINQLKQLAKHDVKVFEVDQNGKQVNISDIQLKGCAIM